MLNNERRMEEANSRLHIIQIIQTRAYTHPLNSIRGSTRLNYRLEIKIKIKMTLQPAHSAVKKE